MRKSSPWFLSLAASLGLVAAVTTPAGADRKPRSGPASNADLESLQKKVEDQQRLIDRLVKLQQQYLLSLSTFFDAPVPVSLSPSKHAPEGDPKPIDPPPPPPRAEPRSMAVEAKPVTRVVEAKPKPKAEGVGTIVGKIEGATDAVIYVEDIVSAPRQGSAEIRQEGRQFVPAVLVVQKGTTVQFPNMDAVFHNVFSVSPDNSFDLGSYRQGDSRSVMMSKAGVVNVYCNMHPQMVSHILVVPNGNFVRTGKDGFFRLTNVPTGHHRVVAWAPNAKPAVTDAEVTDAQVVTVELALKKGHASPHTQKDGLPYGSYAK
jgi:plastocyanin